MSDYLIKDTTLIDIADGIREKEGSVALIDPDDMGDRIRGLETNFDGHGFSVLIYGDTPTNE